MERKTRGEAVLRGNEYTHTQCNFPVYLSSRIFICIAISHTLSLEGNEGKKMMMMFHYTFVLFVPEMQEGKSKQAGFFPEFINFVDVTGVL